LAAYKLRGAMFDPGRIMERQEYYLRMLPHLARWGYNFLQLHLADDQCCALRFPSRPELAGAGAWTAQQMRRLVAEAARLHLAVVPEIEALGHTRFITAHPKYRRLGEKSAPTGFNALCPSHPETRSLLADILRDTVSIFDSEIIHVGLDEVKFGRCRRCGAGESWRRFGRHAAWVLDMVRGSGRRPAMWSDHLLADPRILKYIGKDVLIFDWHYEPDFHPRSVGFFLERGYEVVAVPATICWLSLVLPNAQNLDNLRTSSARVAPLTRKGREGRGRVVGILNTVWTPWRYLPGAVDFGIALGGHLFHEREESGRFPERFAASFYNLEGGAARRVGGALMRLYETAFSRQLATRIVAGSHGGIAFSREDAREAAARRSPLGEILSTLKGAMPNVGRNRDRFEDLLLSAEVELLLARRGASGRKSSARARADAGRLYDRVLAAWGRERRPDDPYREGHGWEITLLESLKRLS